MEGGQFGIQWKVSLAGKFHTVVAALLLATSKSTEGGNASAQVGRHEGGKRYVPGLAGPHVMGIQRSPNTSI